MKIKRKNIRPRFGPEMRFAVTPVPAVPFRGTMETELDRLKDRFLKTRLDETAKKELYAPLRRAANEAAALAWMTPFPLLVFPALFDEKVRTVRLQAVEQERIRHCTQPLMAEAA